MLNIKRTLDNTKRAHTQSKLHKSYKKTNYVKHTLSNKGVDIWNELIPNLKVIKSYTTFKKRIKLNCCGTLHTTRDFNHDLNHNDITCDR